MKASFIRMHNQDIIDKVESIGYKYYNRIECKELLCIYKTPFYNEIVFSNWLTQAAQEQCVECKNIEDFLNNVL
jgi:hypothetical protein